jgi:hypothetical protein
LPTKWRGKHGGKPVVDRDAIVKELRRLCDEAKRIARTPAGLGERRRLAHELLDLGRETRQLAAAMAPIDPAASRALMGMVAEIVGLAQAQSGNGQPPA